MTQRLQSAGWTADSSFQSHGTTLKKNSADAVFYPAMSVSPKDTSTFSANAAT
jgi:hypothetical protein